MRIRKGDKVAILSAHTTLEKHYMVMKSDMGLVRVRACSDRRIYWVNREDIVRIVQRRENIKDWWRYIYG